VELAEAATQRYVAKQFNQLDSKRIAYLFERNGRELQFVLREVWEELRQSQFQPVAVELAFGRGGEMDAISVSGNTMQAELGGFVDRVDAWDNHGQTYFRVVDYKTGKKKFDYCDVLNGIGLQMLLYLFALEDAGDPVLGENRVPTGVMYFPARAPILPANSQLTEAQAKQMRAAEWKRKGLLCDDPEILKAMEPSEAFSRLSCTMNKSGEISGDVASRSQFRLLKSYVYKVLQDMLNDLGSGNVTPNPYTRGTSHDACRYCPYKSVCLQLDITQRRNFKTIKAERFWDDIEKEMNSRGN
jgi:ATP-dependent helicase/nuclease subunit B